MNKSKSYKQTFITFLKKQSIWPILFILAVVLTILTPDFLTFNNIINVVLQSTVYGVMAIGMTFLMINGYFDLSVGTVMGLCAALVIGFQEINMAVAVIASLLCGALIGAFNGFLVSRAQINAFVVTLSTMFGARGLLYIYTKEQAIVGQISAFEVFGASKIGFLPTIVVIFIILLIIGQLFLKYSLHGRHTFAIGGNYEAAKNSGIKVKKTIQINFILSGVAAALGGIILASRMNAATPALGWPDTNLMVIACVVLGGTKLTGGYGSMIHTLGGVMAIGLIQNGMNLLNVQSYFNTLFMGIILILVVYADARFKPLESKI